MSKYHHDTSDLIITSDIPYIADGTEEHLLDIYRPKKGGSDLPVIVNVHGGGLFASYKTVNTWFNYEWARRGYAVVSLSYRRLPETTLVHQIEDVMAALRFISERREQYGLRLDRCYMTGDSAGALLAYFAMSIESSEVLQEAFRIKPSGITFRAAGLISIMLDTQRHDLIAFLSDIVTDNSDSGQPYLPYLLDPVLMLRVAKLPPICLVTSKEDIIGKDTRKFDKVLTEASVEHRLLDYPKGEKNKLVHVFAVQYPLLDESKEVYQAIDELFKAQ